MTYIRDKKSGTVYNWKVGGLPSGDWYEKLTKSQGQEAYKEQAAAKLRTYFKPGDTAHTMLLHVSSNGMSRHIAVMAAEETKTHNGKKKQLAPVNVSHLVADLLGYKLNKGGNGLVVGGCGMDMGFHVVYSMSSRMFPNGTRYPHSKRNGEPDRAGGYAIKHGWL